MHGPQRLRQVRRAYFETRYVEQEPSAARLDAARNNNLAFGADAQARCDQAPGVLFVAACACSCFSDAPPGVPFTVASAQRASSSLALFWQPPGVLDQ